MRWYRHRQTGDRGHMEERDGVQVMVYDRPAVDQWVPYFPNEWAEEPAQRKYSLMELGRIAWVADQELGRVMGTLGRTERRWSELTDSQRQRWVVKGPRPPIEREVLFDAIMNVMRPMAAAES